MESSDTKDLEDLISNFNILARPRPDPLMSTGPKESLIPGLSELSPTKWVAGRRNMTQYGQQKQQSYASNIANIVKTVNTVATPTLEEGFRIFEHSTMMGFKINTVGGSGFPRDVFRAYPRANRQSP